MAAGKGAVAVNAPDGQAPEVGMVRPGSTNGGPVYVSTVANSSTALRLSLVSCLTGPADRQQRADRVVVR